MRARDTRAGAAPAGSSTPPPRPRGAVPTAPAHSPRNAPGARGASPPAGGRRLAVAALLVAGLAAGFALCMNVVHYRTWGAVPAAGFAAFQRVSAAQTVPAAAALGLPSLVLAVLLARRGLPGVARGWLWAAAALAALPWVATPAVLLPLQARLGAAGPAPDLVTRLGWADLLLRTVPPLALAVLHARALAVALDPAEPGRGP